jgi:acetyl esterase/lipase
VALILDQASEKHHSLQLEMDQIAKLNSTAIPAILEPTFRILIPPLIANSSLILSIPRKTFSYGPHPRQTLDMYCPSTDSSDGTPVLIFLYGGGLSRGDKILPLVPHSLIYHNLGTFFALRGFTTVIPDYRRVDDPKAGTGEGATYPSGGEDVAAVLDWLQSASCPLQPAHKQREVFILGNSAGGIHLATYLLDAQFESGRKRLIDGSSGYRLCGAVLLGVALDFKSASPQRRDTLDRYWPASLSLTGALPGRSGELFCANGLLQSLKQRNVTGETARPANHGIPDLLVLLGEFDPEDEIVEPGMRFCGLWKEAFGGEAAGMELKRIKGHNHISPPLALMTGDVSGEEWGEEVVGWMNKTMKRGT